MTELWPDSQSHPRYTDSYFNLTRKILQEHGDIEVTYAVFMRRPVTLASKMAIDCWNIDEKHSPIPQYILDKHFLRKHGPEAYYGQNTTDLESL